MSAIHSIRRPFVGISFALACAVPAAAQDVLVKAARILVAPDSTLTDSALLLRDGKVAFVGDDIPAEARSGARVVDYGSATLSPGFVLAATTMGRDADLAEGAFAFTPDLRVAEAFDPWLDDLAHLAPRCVTSFGLTPSQRNVAGGIGVLAKPGKEQGRIAAADAFVGFSLTSAARSQERVPTSLMGAKDMLREAFEAARIGVEVGPDLAVMREVLSGSRRALVYANTYAELNAALDLARDNQIAPVIIGAADADKVMKKLAAHSAGIVLGSLAPGARKEDLQLPKKLAEANIPFCFGGSSERMRLSAMLAVRNGLPRQAAHAALTRTPATMLGQQASVGSLRQGCAGDFVVFDGDLLDMSSRHLATWVDGKLIVGKASSKSSTSPATPMAGGSR